MGAEGDADRLLQLVDDPAESNANHHLDGIGMIRGPAG